MDCSCPCSNGMNGCPNRPITAPDCIGGLVRFLKKRKPDGCLWNVHGHDYFTGVVVDAMHPDAQAGKNQKKNGEG